MKSPKVDYMIPEELILDLQKFSDKFGLFFSTEYKDTEEISFTIVIQLLSTDNFHLFEWI